jgi:DNA (cytosine-5)-methyltransferase 1
MPMRSRTDTCERNGHAARGLAWVKLATWPPPLKERPRRLSLVDLFCGCGGLSLGVWEGARQQSRRLEIRLAVDWNAQCLAVYKANFQVPRARVILNDVGQLFDGRLGQKLTASEGAWRAYIQTPDLLVAGPPCQGHSDLNNSTRREDPRNGFYLRVVRAAEILRPKAVIIENVPAVLLDKNKVAQRAADWFERNRYQVSHAIVQLGRFGVPQLRKRHILVAVSGGNFSFSDLDAIHVVPPTAGEYLAGLEDEPDGRGELFYRPSLMTDANLRRVEHLFKYDQYDLPDLMRPSCHRDKDHKYTAMYGRLHSDRPAQTMTSGFGSMGQGRYVHPTRKRLLTPHEAARLQGFPEFFDFSSATTLSSLREMIANAVPPQFTAALVSRLISNRII